MPRVRRSVATFLMLSLATVSVAEVYKWTDAQGKVHYGDSPPPEQKRQQVRIRIRSLGGPATVGTVETAAPIRRDRVRLFGATWCGYCKLAKAHLARRGIAYEDVDVEASDSGRREYEALGGRGVPIILVGRQRMDGFDAAGLDDMLARAGY